MALLHCRLPASLTVVVALRWRTRADFIEYADTRMGRR